jgi:hypothetical protein
MKVLKKIKNYLEQAKEEPTTAGEINMAYDIEKIIEKEEKDYERNQTA